MIKFRKILCQALAVLMLMSNFYFNTDVLASPQNAAKSKIAPLNQNFLNYIGSSKTEKINGRVPEPYTITKSKSAGIKSDSSLPEQFDLRNVNGTIGITSVKDQGNIGSCWTFAACGAMESNLKYKQGETYDFSENNMITNNGFDYSPDEGGNRTMSVAYFAKWAGPVLESDDPYPSPAYSSNIITRNGLNPVKHLQDAIFIPARTSFTDYNEFKQAIMQYGAVDSSIYWPSDNDVSDKYNASTASYYYNADGKMLNSNDNTHEIAIVGWNDNYSKYNFVNTPPGNGAFICKNSWGASWGEDGYFYVSYYDSSIAEEGTVYLTEGINNYDNIYQYDPLGMVDQLGFGNNTAWFSNVFTPESSEGIEAVSFYTTKENTQYEIYTENNFDKNKFNNIKSHLAASGTIAMPGYHTIKFDTPVIVTPSSKFAVAVKLVENGEQYPVGIESKLPGYSGNATASIGQSYVSPDGQNWEDLQDVSLSNGESEPNVCLKVFTDKVDAVSPRISGIDLSDGTQNTPINQKINITFDQNINYSNENVVVTDSRGKTIDTDQSIQNNTLSVSPSSLLEYGMKYYVQIPYKMASDDNGSSATVISFTTCKQPQNEFYRLWGTDRYATSIAISQEGWKTSDYVVLAKGNDYPDALCAVPLAKAYKAPILLTDSNALTASVSSEIDRLGVKKAIIAGGVGAISDNIITTLKSRGIVCTRLGGDNRYDTSVIIANYLIENSGNRNQVVIATGNNFPDALSVASYAGFKGIPILLTTKDSVPDKVRNFIGVNSISSTYVIGGTGVISDSVYNSLPNPRRFGGNNRYETNYKVISSLAAEYDLNSVFMATGEDFPDALCGAALAAVTKSPVILMSKDSTKNGFANILYDNNSTGINSRYIFGGKGVISDSVVLSVIQ